MPLPPFLFSGKPEGRKSFTTEDTEDTKGQLVHWRMNTMPSGEDR